MAQVKVIQSSEVGIHLSIDKVEYGFNKSTNTFKQRRADGKFVTVEPTPYVRAILKNQFEAAAQKKKTDDIRAWIDALDLKTMTEADLREAQRKIGRAQGLPAWLTRHMDSEINNAVRKLKEKPYVPPVHQGYSSGPTLKAVWG